jgi:hypothetical protein
LDYGHKTKGIGIETKRAKKSSIAAECKAITCLQVSSEVLRLHQHLLTEVEQEKHCRELFALSLARNGKLDGSIALFLKIGFARGFEVSNFSSAIGMHFSKYAGQQKGVLHPHLSAGCSKQRPRTFGWLGARPKK